MNRAELIRKLDRSLGRRRLIWVGTRGEDAQPLLELPQFSYVFSITAALHAVSVDTDLALEDITSRRVDLDRYSLDSDSSPEALYLREELYKALGSPATLVAYRPLAFLSAAYFPRGDYVTYLGLFHECQAPFEHKPWVETELRRAGVRVLPWRYFHSEDRRGLSEFLKTSGPVVLRPNKSDGGAGIRLIRKPADLNSEPRFTAEKAGFVAAAPLLANHIPLNVNACVFPGGRVSLHGPSVQLIGIAECTQRAFGYCGNDFAAIRDIDGRVLSEFNTIAVRVGKWLSGNGYTGAFGVDCLVHDGKVYLTEVNPRFQGSSFLSAVLDRELGRPDIFLEHIAAFLGIPPSSKTTSLNDLAARQAKAAQLICHNTTPGTCIRTALDISGAVRESIGLLPSPEVGVEPEGVLFRLQVNDRVTTTGLEICPFSRDRLKKLSRQGFRQANSRLVES